MADVHSTQCDGPRAAALEKVGIFAERQCEQNDRILALLAGAIALLDRDKDGCAVTLLEIAFDAVGDRACLIALEGARQEAASL